MSGPVSVAVASANTLGEGVLWCDREQVVYWTDIQRSQLWRYRPQDGATARWPMPERLAAMALCEADGWLLLALASRLAFFHPERNEFRDLQGLHGVAPTDTRANDGACDRQGRFVFGMLHEPAEGPKQAVAPFLRLNADLTLETLRLPPAAISNSIAFSPRGDTMYFCDSLQKQIWRCDYASTLGQAQLFVDLRDEVGEPDGSAVDADGGLWNARWGDARVVRYLPDGNEDRSIATPVSQPTRPAFGGPAHRMLFITSAHDGLSAAVRAQEPLAGHLLAIDAGIAGLPEARFAGDPTSLPPRAVRGTSAEIP
ncbi:MAG TPA: gluconolaconase [Stenotrophomonas sp.]|uniref:SMP-30/gluconolactonase/LRE family protein n=1 Tax=Stenotrophomonas sp. TaxID=69392 RepID=UPI000E9501B2|nr:SMP-30/gluconolactonase/LRE family protein [Stenotrophomonas sp.]HBS61756.1 gluconolaconase [Stenotrophomonas sp.]